MRWTLVIGAAFVVMHMALPGMAAERADLKEAFKAGQVELTLTAKDDGATLELKIKNRTNSKLLLVIPQGKTPFDVYNSKVLLVAAVAKHVDLLAEGDATFSFPMEQSGGGRWTSGSVIQSVTPPSPPRQ
jgi:hypothetical protein